MSPRRPVLPGPTSTERRGLDTGRGGTGGRRTRGGEKWGAKERKPEGRRAGRDQPAPAAWVLSQAPLTTFLRSYTAGVSAGLEDDGQSEGPAPPNLSARVPQLPPSPPRLPLVLGLEGTLLSGVRGGIGSREGSGTEFRTVTK